MSEDVMLLLNEILGKLSQPAVRQEWFSIAEVSTITGLSDKHIRRAANRGELASTNVGGNGSERATIRISRNAIDEWMNSKATHHTPTRVTRSKSVQKWFGEKQTA